MSRYVCIHGHFYQPPRENPWLEEIELQDSAYPYHDWNERITNECYATNAASRILDPQRRIQDIVTNYPRMSFNFGPTLLSWMEKFSPETYSAILAADKESQERFSGHGSAMAQAYNHMIMPLANERDKRTQVIWGIKDFEYRFNRKPEGMWLPETAVDVETLEILADHGVKFTILAPRQARRIRKIGDKNWRDVRDGRIDPQRAYRFQLPSGQTMVLFFYDGGISQEVAFAGLLNDGVGLAHRLAGSLPADSEQPRIAHIATDGESYGHHHRFGDMALAYCFCHMESQHLAKVTIYAEYLEKHPPVYEVKIFENSSWSCVHGVERWREDCGCNSGLKLGWKQPWRKPLRLAMDWLRDAVAPIYEKEMGQFADDPWGARDEYIDVILNRTEERVEQFFGRCAKRKLSAADRVRALKLLEMQRHAMLMYTSCGWFFDDISGIETVQIMQYAARVIQLAREISGVDLEPHYIERLGGAPSNIAEFNNGAQIYETLVKPTVVDLLRVGVHYAVSSVFEEYPETTSIYSFTIKRESQEQQAIDKKKLVIGKVRIRSEVTGEEGDFSFTVFHLGDHTLNGGVKPFPGDDAFAQMQKDIKAAFLEGDIPKLDRVIQDHFDTHHRSLWHLFKDEQEKVLNRIMDVTLQELKALFKKIYEYHYPLLQSKENIRISLPQALAATIEFVMNRDLRELLEEDYLDLARLEQLVEEVRQWSFELDNASLSFMASRRVNALLQELWKAPENVALLEKIEGGLRILSALPLQLDLWKAQNIYFLLGKKFYEPMNAKSAQDPAAQRWTQYFKGLGKYLEVKGV